MQNLVLSSLVQNDFRVSAASPRHEAAPESSPLSTDGSIEDGNVSPGQPSTLHFLTQPENVVSGMPFSRAKPFWLEPELAHSRTIPPLVLGRV